MSPDPAKRLEAAQSVFAPRDAAALPALEQALAAEQDPAVRSALAEARAAILLADAGRRRAGPAGRGRDAAGARRPGGAGDPGALPADRAPECPRSGRHGRGRHRAPPAARRRRPERVFGISLGSVLLLAAIGLAITFGVMGVINMAHGEMVMLGAYTTFVIQEFCRTSFPAGLELVADRGHPAAFLVAGGHGRADRARTVIRRLYGRPLETCSPPGASR